MAKSTNGVDRPKARAWMNANGFPQGSRGRFTPSGREAWNAAHPFERLASAGNAPHVRTVTVSAKPVKGRTVTKTVKVPEIRAAALAAGVQVGAIGRLSEAVKSAFVLGTLSSLASPKA